MLVRDLMGRDVRCCVPTDSLARAAQIMWDFDCGVVPVIDTEKKVVGIVTDRDICMAAYTQGKNLSDMTVDGAMAKHVIRCHPENSLTEVEELMRVNQVRRLPVVDDNNRILGLVSLSSVAVALLHQTPKKGTSESFKELAHTFAAISEPRTLHHAYTAS